MSRLYDTREVNIRELCELVEAGEVNEGDFFRVEFRGEAQPIVTIEEVYSVNEYYADTRTIESDQNLLPGYTLRQRYFAEGFRSRLPALVNEVMERLPLSEFSIIVEGTR